MDETVERGTTPTEPARLVADGYDALGGRYRGWAREIGDDQRNRWVERLVAALAPGARVLDLGCGPGVPTARRMAEQFDVTGVDISERQIGAARAAVPSGRFIVADIRTVEFGPASFEAVVALYSLIHVPNVDVPRVLGRIHDWLVLDGLFVATLGTVEGEGVQADWLGVPMFFAGHAPEHNRMLLSDAGFELLDEEVATITEPGEGEVEFHWLLAQRTA